MSIKINSLDYAYQNEKVLNNIVASFKSGQFYGIIGPNGSGKTTLLKLIANLLSTPHNSVFIADKDVTKYKEKDRARRIALVPQIFNMEYAFTVEDVVAMGRYPYLKGMGELSMKDDEIIEEALLQTSLIEYRKRFVNALSGGELQRVILARAIAQQSDFILLDEPLSHLDIHHQLDILNLTKKLCEDGKTVICVLHDLNLAMKYCNQVMMLERGNIFKFGDTDTVLTTQHIKAVYGIDVEIIEVNNQKRIIF